MCLSLCLCVYDFQVFYTEVRNGRPSGAASLMEVPLSLDMLTTVSTLTYLCGFMSSHLEVNQTMYEKSQLW